MWILSRLINVVTVHLVWPVLNFLDDNFNYLLT